MAAIFHGPATFGSVLDERGAKRGKSCLKHLHHLVT
jgi:hypothetical protein